MSLSELPVKQYFEAHELRSWNTVYKHFHKWSSDHRFQQVWVSLLDQYRSHLDLSSMQINGSQTRSHQGGEAVSYQKRRADQTTNLLFLSDKKGNIVGMSNPIDGKHHDLHQIQTHFDQTLSYLQKAGIHEWGCRVRFSRFLGVL